MNVNQLACTPDTKTFIVNLLNNMAELINVEVTGIYIHGSLAIGGFNPASSDLDLLVVTEKAVTVETKRKLAKLFLTHSSSPIPVEVSFLNIGQLTIWQHPCPYDFHYSEFWRERYSNELLNGTNHFINGDVHTDSDLAAHITIINNRGICVMGKPIEEVFPFVPFADYVSSIMDDFKCCLEKIEQATVYCILNSIRVYRYLKEGVISSKLEAGNWGVSRFPKEIGIVISKVIDCYLNGGERVHLEKDELEMFKRYISYNVQRLLNEKGNP